MSAQGHTGGTGDIPEQHSETNRPAEKHESVDKSGKRIIGELSHQDREGLNERTKDERNPEKRLSQKTSGRGTFGECAIADIKLCGQNKETAVQLKNGLPEKIETASQNWERDAKNPQIWHVQEGKEKFDLKADVRLQGDDITVRVKYQNGREVNYKNGEATEISHPDGEKWTRDSKNPGVWNVAGPNKDNPSKIEHFTIQDVNVNAKDGDITWHVDRGAGKGHDREISGQNQYFDSKNGVSTIPQERNLPEHAKAQPGEHAHAQPQHEQTHAAIHHEQGHIERAQPHPEPVHMQPHAEQAQSQPSRAEQAQTQPRAEQARTQPRPEQAQTQPRPERVEAPPVPRPHVPQQHLEHIDAKPAAPPPARTDAPPPPAPTPLAPKHFESPSPVLQVPFKAEFPPHPIQQTMTQAELPSPAQQPHRTEAPQQRQPQPTPPPERHFDKPSPAQPPEQHAFVPRPQAPEIHEVSTPHPLAQPIKDSAPDLQRQNQQSMENNLKSMQERMAKAQAEAVEMLPKVATSSMPIPALPDAQAARMPNAFPVLTPAVLNQHAESPMPKSRPENHYSQPAPAPTPLHLESKVAQPVLQPVAPKEASYTYSAPPIADIKTHNDSAAPVPVAQQTSLHSDTAGPAPTRIGGQHITDHPLALAPSVPKPELTTEAQNYLQPAAHAAAEVRTSPVQQNQHHEQPKLQGKVAYGAEAQNAQAGDAAPIQQGPHLFSLGATHNENMPRQAVQPYGLPQKVYDPNEAARLQARAEQSNFNLHAQASAQRHEGHISGQRMEQNPFYDGSGIVPLADPYGKVHDVPIKVQGVVANQNEFQATLDHNKGGTNQVRWVAGKIVNGVFCIEQARIDNGQPFPTSGTLQLHHRR